MYRSVVITGASSGIGAALALRYARAGAQLGLLGRNRERLVSVAERCVALGAQVQWAAIDVTAREEMADWLAGFDREYPIDLVIANAGVISGVAPGERIESERDSRRILEINVIGVQNTVHPVLPAMLDRRSGTIAIISSVAGFVPLPQMPSYSASKAAALSYGLALRTALRPRGIQVCVACPGFVETPMIGQIHGRTPFRVSVEHAAEQIQTGIARNRAVIAFPWLFATVLRLVGFLPDRLRSILLSSSRFRVSSRD
jgi:short-subunit dehydrogenase